jgi:hypothetical protein
MFLGRYLEQVLECELEEAGVRVLFWKNFSVVI